MQFFVDEKYTELDHYFVYGIKIEANANRYLFDWGKTVVKQQAELASEGPDFIRCIDASELEDEKEHEEQTLQSLVRPLK
ncbi:hypothetical protein [Cohnella panacarvi]|uniref:hypothetical protein n=1 Tax=Cohnella panacarvi TaxID=400776 RepID=UPI000479BA34|nr:hypothetical protein [Cohnella panacarvi]